jgi:hypothetical protein
MFWVHLFILSSAGYYGGSIQVMRIVEVENFMKRHVCKVQTTIFLIKQKYMTLEPLLCKLHISSRMAFPL